MAPKPRNRREQNNHKRQTEKNTKPKKTPLKRQEATRSTRVTQGRSYASVVNRDQSSKRRRQRTLKPEPEKTLPKPISLLLAMSKIAE